MKSYYFNIPCNVLISLFRYSINYVNITCINDRVVRTFALCLWNQSSNLSRVELSGNCFLDVIRVEEAVSVCVHFGNCLKAKPLLFFPQLWSTGKPTSSFGFTTVKHGITVEDVPESIVHPWLLANYFSIYSEKDCEFNIPLGL